MTDEIRKTDERVRLRAYRLWECDGRPHGRNDEYWQRALQQIQQEGAGGTPQRTPTDTSS